MSSLFNKANIQAINDSSFPCPQSKNNQTVSGIFNYFLRHKRNFSTIAKLPHSRTSRASNTYRKCFITRPDALIDARVFASYDPTKLAKPHTNATGDHLSLEVSKNTKKNVWYFTLANH